MPHQFVPAEFMTYEEKVQAVINKLDSNGADSEREWAESILIAIGITKDQESTSAEGD